MAEFENGDPIKVLFSFDYETDKSRVQTIVSELCDNDDIIPVIGYYSWWDDDFTSKAVERAQKRLEEAVCETDVTVICIGNNTSEHIYINYAIGKTMQHGNGLAGLFIHHLPGKMDAREERPPVPGQFDRSGIPVEKYESPEQLAALIRKAANKRTQIH